MEVTTMSRTDARLYIIGVNVWNSLWAITTYHSTYDAGKNGPYLDPPRGEGKKLK
jgi:hypothetical protein